MARYGMVIDTKKCVGCADCVVACKTENNVPDGYCRDWIVEDVRGAFPDLHMEIRSERCNHCENAPCVRCCPTGASYTDEDYGVVLVDKDLCTGCKACIASCPYDARYVHPEGYVDKCTFCMHRVREGLDPACVAVCPTKCMYFGDLDDANSEVSKLIRSRPNHALIPEAGTKPKIFYLL
ncbi:MAG: 4Fe-4S dicluster domain-containing protein [Calditrichaeota bacterium]|nr:MAG: 4Fe-4S dicluster domain-containing protein [Calditrichota bacterium]